MTSTSRGSCAYRDLRIPKGFYLRRRKEHCSDCPEVAYRGIDRGIYVEDPIKVRNWLHSDREDERRRAGLWEAYWEAEEDGRLLSDAQIGLELLERFSQEGIELELVYAEVLGTWEDPHAFPRGEEKEAIFWDTMLYYRNREELFRSRPPGFVFLGYDVSWAIPSHHSAIMQPMKIAGAEHVVQALNENGLFGDKEQAAHFMDEANRLDYSRDPFCIVGVWTLGG